MYYIYTHTDAYALHTPGSNLRQNIRPRKTLHQSLSFRCIGHQPGMRFPLSRRGTSLAHLCGATWLHLCIYRCSCTEGTYARGDTGSWHKGLIVSDAVFNLQGVINKNTASPICDNACLIVKCHNYVLLIRDPVKTTHGYSPISIVS